MKEKNLTSRQLEIFNYIKALVLKKGVPPSIREIGKAVGMSSVSTVHAHLKSLEKKGYIKRDKAKPRHIELLKELPQKRALTLSLLSGITPKKDGGWEKVFSDSFTLPAELAGEPEAFLFRNQGDSMKEAAIMDGDLLLVQKQESVENGDIILARVEKELTVKRYFKTTGLIRLDPDNHRMRPIFVRELEILGKVIGLIRKFQEAG